MSGEIVKVKFYEDTIDAVRDGHRVLVSLKRCCENLGVNVDGQRKKLAAKSWAVTEEMSATGPDGKQYQTTMMSLNTLPMWLATIEPRKVKPEIREKLERYQNEAAQVLADHFFARTAEPVNLDAVIEAVIARIRAESAQLPAPGSMPAVPRFTVAERLRFKGWFTASKKQRHTIRRLANALLDSRHQETPDIIGGYTFWYAHQLLCLDEAIDRVREDAERGERAAGPNLLTVTRP